MNVSMNCTRIQSYPTILDSTAVNQDTNTTQKVMYNVYSATYHQPTQSNIYDYKLQSKTDVTNPLANLKAFVMVASSKCGVLKSHDIT